MNHFTSNAAKAVIAAEIILEILNDDASYIFENKLSNIINALKNQGLSKPLIDSVLARLFDSGQIEYAKDKHSNLIVKAVREGGANG